MSENQKNIYITTAIPYVNGAPHLGHAMDYLLADTYTRYQKLNNKSVRFQAGTDEHGSKIYKKAAENGVEVKAYVSENSKKFQDFIKKLGVEYTDFIRTTDKDHERRVQEIWQKLEPHIYKNSYEGWYCEGCERFITQKEYDENGGVCPDHQKPYEKLSEENYYLRISDFKDEIKRAIKTDEMKILPDFRKKEILKLLEDSPDVSISRPKEHVKWGVKVPGDEDQIMYVWPDALANYITVLGYPDEDISEFWPANVQIVGKDILRFHTIIWPAMLLGLGLPLPKTLLSHGFVLANGQKMSKSIGNVVDPLEVLGKHGLPAFRYYFLRHADTFLDADYTDEKYEEAYNNELANDLGNLVQRLAAMCKKQDLGGLENFVPADDEKYREIMDALYFSRAFDYAWEKVQAINKRIDDTKPWELAKAGKSEELKTLLNSLATDLLNANHLLKPFLPETTETIEKIFTAEKIVPGDPLFPKSLSA
ncbi:methionine--tRNA ligase [Candidatus Saccharibacteria bacterium]|nr:methionine--tRNA ligase [Candidatus Saccharibacteria bacterium]